jgi:hypothetical protein
MEIQMQQSVTERKCDAEKQEQTAVNVKYVQTRNSYHILIILKIFKKSGRNKDILCLNKLC